MVLNREEIETPRSADELSEWCLGKIELLAQSGETENLRLRRGPYYKQLLEEVYPLAVWARDSGLSQCAQITPAIGSQSYDAVVTDDSSDPSTFFLEITQAHMGQSEYFRNLHINAHGWAPGPLTEMTRVGSETIPGRIMNSREGRIFRTEQLIASAIQRKLQKEYEPPIDLIVAFEDFGLDEEAQIIPRLTELAHREVDGLPNPFRRLFLTGMSGKLHLCMTINA